MKLRRIGKHQQDKRVYDSPSTSVQVETELPGVLGLFLGVSFLTVIEHSAAFGHKMKKSIV